MNRRELSFMEKHRHKSETNTLIALEVETAVAEKAFTANR